jgi:putative transposase
MTATSPQRKCQVCAARARSTDCAALAKTLMLRYGDRTSHWCGLQRRCERQGSSRRTKGAAMKVIGNASRQDTGRWRNNRAENSHLPFRRREHAMLRFRRMQSLQKFASVHASIYNHFNQQRHLYSRDNFKLNRTTALSEWKQLCSALVRAIYGYLRLVRISLTAQPALFLKCCLHTLASRHEAKLLEALRECPKRCPSYHPFARE